MNKGVLSLVIGVIAICIGYYRTHYCPIADIVLFFGYTLIISVITLFSCKNITKALDFLCQAMPIGWAYISVFTMMLDSKAADAGQSFLAVIGVEIFLLPYQFFSSIVMVVRQFSRNELSKTGMIRLILCILVVGLSLLLLITARNRDYDYGEFTANFIDVVTDKIFPFCIMPFFFILTLIERFLDIVKIKKKPNS